MTDIKRQAIVDYSPAEMYALVDAIEDYPKFLPWCHESKILSRDEDEVQATLAVAAAGFSKEFTTHNRLQKNKMIEIRLVNGPFQHLEGFWRFDEVEDGKTRVALDLEFEFAGGFLDFAFGPIFYQMSNNLVDAFGKRAEEVYGKR